MKDGMNENEIREKLNRVLDLKNRSVYSLVSRKDSMKGQLERQVKGTTRISLDVLLIFADRFPDLDLNWLLRGDGDEPFISVAGKLDQANKIINDAQKEMARLKSASAAVNAESKKGCKKGASK